MRKLFIILLLAGIILPATAQDKRMPRSSDVVSIGISDTLTDAFLDTVQVRKKLKLNDYSLIGFQYGAGLSQVMWNPTQKQDMVFIPVNIGITYTLYGKMFGYMPYFGFQTGIFYGQEGYQFETNTIEGAKKAIMDVIEVPILSHIHIDLWNFKILAQIGLFGGYRLGIHRYPGDKGNVNPLYENSFTKTDIRFDYGIKGGVGFGLVFDPVEIHIQAMYKHSLSSLYEPDHDPVYGKYFYRYAYPSNIVLSAGLHFQLTKRSGMTKKELKKKARSIVYGN